MRLATDGPLSEEEVEANRAERILTERLNGTYQPWPQLVFEQLIANRNAGRSEQRIRNPYVSPAPAEQLRKAGRNDACPCGSGRKVKYCCGG